MKNLKSIMMIAAVAAILMISSCTKDGVQGPAGTAGTNGTNGSNGNANVKEYLYGADSISAVHDFTRIVPYRFSALDSAVTLFYFYDATGLAWYEAGELGAFEAYQTRSILGSYNAAGDSTNLTIRVYSPTGTAYTGTVQITKAKFIIIPASTVVSGKTSIVDYSNYKATMKYLGLPE